MGRGRAGGAAKAKGRRASSGSKAGKGGAGAAAVAEHFGASNARVRFSPDASREGIAKLKGDLRTIFGRDLSHREIASLVGAPHNATVMIAEPVGYGLQVDLLIKAPGLNASRSVGRDKKGKLFVKNNFFELTTSGTGLGTQVFGRQVEQAQKLGVKYIKTEAARQAGVYNGYYTWARLGYNAKLSAPVRASLPAGLKGARSVQELMRTKAGRDWWKEHGTTTYMKFSLTNRISRRVLGAYVKERGL